MDATTMLTRCLLGTALTCGLLAFGVTFTGLDARAAQAGWFQPAWRGAVAPLPNAQARVGQATLSGLPTQVLRGQSERSPRSVFQHYRRQALAAGGGETLVEVDHGADGGVLAWIGDGGERLGVIVEPNAAGGSRYRLLDSRPPTQPAHGALGLPAGLAAPHAFSVISSVTHDDGTGHALLAYDGGVQDAAAALREHLEAHGFTVDAGAARALAAAQPDTDRLALPFAGDGRRGLLIVASNTGRARITLSVSEG